MIYSRLPPDIQMLPFLSTSILLRFSFMPYPEWTYVIESPAAYRSPRFVPMITVPVLSVQPHCMSGTPTALPGGTFHVCPFSSS